MQRKCVFDFILYYINKSIHKSRFDIYIFTVSNVYSFQINVFDCSLPSFPLFWRSMSNKVSLIHPILLSHEFLFDLFLSFRREIASKLINVEKILKVHLYIKKIYLYFDAFTHQSYYTSRIYSICNAFWNLNQILKEFRK
jgi:hypothetical protein